MLAEVCGCSNLNQRMNRTEILSPSQSGIIIAKNARYITICEDGINKCAQEVCNRVKKGKIKLVNAPTEENSSCNYIKKDIVHPQIADQEGVDWVFFIDALNFSFWNFSSGNNKQYLVTYKGTTYTGYLAFCAAVCRTLDSGIPLTRPSFYSIITEDQLNAFLMGDHEVECPLIKERVSCLHEIAEVLNQKYESSFVNCIKQCEAFGNQKAQKLLDLIRNEFPCFRDEAEYNPQADLPAFKVSFMKRAQILIADIWTLFEGKELGQFDDINSITMFADYRIPQSLQYFGALKYSDELIKELNKPEQVMEHGSIYEIEIRGCSIEAVNRIVAKSQKLLATVDVHISKHLNCVIVDYFLWGFRREKADEMLHYPYHKVRSIYY